MHLDDPRDQHDSVLHAKPNKAMKPRRAGTDRYFAAAATPDPSDERQRNASTMSIAY
jgi:hypothetical protein